MEKELVDDNLSLPSQHLVNGRFPPSLGKRPGYVVPKEFISPNRTSYSQDKLAQILSSGEMPKWVKEFMLSELKPLFMRTRHLDNSKKNQLMKDFLGILFPQFSKQNNERKIALASELRKQWNNWRNLLWSKLMSRYNKYIKYQENVEEPKNPISYLKCNYISEVFSTWLKFVTSNSKENEEALRNLIVFGFHCLQKHPKDAHDRFFSSVGNLYTINCHFQSEYNVATSMDLSTYEIITLGDNDSEDLDDEYPRKVRKLGVHK